MEPFLGTWKLTESDGYDELMRRLGVNAVMAKIGSTLKPKYSFTDLGDGRYQIRMDSTMKKAEFTFKLGEECDEVTPDDRHVKSTVTVEDGVMKQVQVGKPRSTLVERVVEGNTMTVTVKLDDFVCKRKYTKC
ncbi:unnamed protein product [Mesocestoides corti]|uniref:FABP domain-containing protein n=1 Tax=Mesocestoides corti TaxID=53468 RepID=A0A0R3UAJ9_MESCO|nr:unnamed protein product [Mesocestoides corti]